MPWAGCGDIIPAGKGSGVQGLCATPQDPLWLPPQQQGVC